MEHRTLADLERRLPYLRAAPREAGTVLLVVRRPATGQRELVDEGRLEPGQGLVGDNWLSRGSSSTRDGSANREAELTLMSHRVAGLLAEDPARQALAGDQLYVDLDLSVDALPPGSTLAVGEAVVEVSAKPHTGCSKFVERFGADAMRFVNGRVGRELRLRGVNARVVSAGRVRPGDGIRPLESGS